MLKRLIEVALPLKEVSEQSAREKSIRHGHISTLHIWWARRPLAACRAVVFASLIPDPDDPECPDSFPALVGDLLPKTPNGEDTPRNRCLEFIKHLVKWENSNNEELVGKARKLIAAAHKFLHPDADGDMPKVLDPFAGGGAIPLEALRLGCEAHAIDLNPVAHLIELCTLVYPQKYGQPNSRPTPDYIKKLEAAKGGDGLFAKQDGKSRASCADEIDGIALTRLPLISEAEYRKNPLAADLKFWGHWVSEKTRDEIGQFYPTDPDGSVPVAYLWARTVKCPNPACEATIPLVRQYWLCKKPNRRVAIRLNLGAKPKQPRFAVVEGENIDFDPGDGTVQRGKAVCPYCQSVADSKYLQAEGNAGRVRHEMMASVRKQPGRSGRLYRAVNATDTEVVRDAEQALARAKRDFGDEIVPNEKLIAWSGVFNAPLFGMTQWKDLYSDRQLLALTTLVRHIRASGEEAVHPDDDGYGRAIAALLTMNLGRLADLANSLCAYEPIAQCPRHLFGRQAIPMVWDYAEGVPPSSSTCSWENSLDRTLSSLSEIWHVGDPAQVRQGSAARMPFGERTIPVLITDPPYYDAVPYSDLSDFFFVWHKRSLGDLFPAVFRTGLTPKSEELVSHLGNNYPGERKTSRDYEQGMMRAFVEMHRVATDNAVLCIMFAHKTTSAWESLIAALIKSGLAVSASWPIHTEMKSRLRGMDSAALASSVTLVCRKRLATAGEGYWDDVRDELREVARERLDFFWKQGIRGADFFISAIGPALSVYGRYAKVTRLTGEEVSVGQFLEEVRGIVTDYALSQILHGAKTGHGTSAVLQIDSETRFYVLWKWSYGDGKVAADEAFKLSQALGIDTEEMWDRTGVLEKQGQNVQALTVAKRMRIKDLGEPNVDGSPATLIDTLHRCCAFRDKGDTGGLSEYLARSGHGRNEKLWTVAQAISEVLPDGDKEKQLLQGLLNQRDKIDEALAEERLF